MTSNTRVLIRNLPREKLAATDYEVVEAPMPSPAEGEVLCQTLAIGVGTGARAGLQGSASYAGAPQTGIVMNGQTISRVTESRAPGVNEGDLVICGSGWQAWAAHPARAVVRVPAIDDPAHYVGALGTNGLTAYFGLLVPWATWSARSRDCAVAASSASVARTRKAPAWSTNSASTPP